ncbi:MAG TPA: sigma-70 family RNA polymerase sigma factor [Blastocatellia bacterium]|nr:sigma-70 family RNA polymerase sigma factor [Blastocatellia bacterium]
MDRSSVSKPEWTLTEESFAKFLDRLAPDRERAGEEYEKLRLMLVKLFDWRGAHFPEECADETLNRVARKIDSGEVIRDMVSYCHAIARLVFLETLKHPDHKRVSLDELTPIAAMDSETEDDDTWRQCFNDCLRELPVASRQLILEYYREEKRTKIENRLRIAEKLDIPLNALRSRAQRVRKKLEECVNRCRQRKL